jgi:hypothetical protein
MKVYTEGTEPLQNLLEQASAADGATLLVPDLQRPYVWSPSQVTLLVDSLLRGWPFGTLLLWKVSGGDLARIPSRTFWQVVDRSEERAGNATFAPSNPPGAFRMVLDGQQRLQSLVLAFYADTFGFRLSDRDWSLATDSAVPKGRNARAYWSHGVLALDHVAFRSRIEEVKRLVRVDFRDVLVWAVLDPARGRSNPAWTSCSIPTMEDRDNTGRFVRLSRLWNEASTEPGLYDQDFADRLEPILTDHGVSEDTRKAVLTPLSQLLGTMRNLKLSKVSFLELSAFGEAGVTEDVYNDAIVNIFTRLNSAGRALTRQEITFAWIKNGWDPASTEGRTAGECFDNLAANLKTEGVSLDLDALVGAVSVMWAVLFREGTLLTAADLLRGEKVWPMANELDGIWDTILLNATEAVRTLRERGLVLGEHYTSTNVLSLLLTWRLLGRRWLALNPLGVTARDAFEKSLEAAFEAAGDRWILLSQWSKRWAKGTDTTMAGYAKDLAKDWSSLRDEKSPETVLDTLRARMEEWIAGLQVESLKTLNDLAVDSRETVYQYHLPLWLWHRLDKERWTASKVSLRDRKRGSVRIEVDHVVAVKLWDTLADAPAAPNSDGGVATTPGAMPESPSEELHALGNCSLLEKSFNIAKGAEPFSAFLGKVHEFKEKQLDADQWAASLTLTPLLLNPAGASRQDVEAAIQARTSAIKAELREYVEGKRQRADIGD